MAKKIKSAKLQEEEEEQKGKQSINNIYEEREDDGLMSINMALEKEKAEAYNEEEDSDYMNDPTEGNIIEDQTKEEDPLNEEMTEEEEFEKNAQLKLQKADEEGASKGYNIPVAQAQRDPKKDKDPIEGEDLGLQEDDFLLSRKVSKEDLYLHNQMQDEELLGSTESKPKDFMDVFNRGPSTNNSPKVDTTKDIENNAMVQKEVAAKQLLRNFHSSDSTEKANTENILSELKIDTELIKEIEEDKSAYKNDNLIDIIKNLL
ncbi:MAG: hypothetical protein MK207_13100 [Saprospiraceae bacterium]|nr:hypothetical protein [Saprospiraceae bacterium]